MIPGDYAQFGHLPSDVHATPIRVAAVDTEGNVRLEGRLRQERMGRLWMRCVGWS